MAEFDILADSDTITAQRQAQLQALVVRIAAELAAGIGVGADTRNNMVLH